MFSCYCRNKGVKSNERNKVNIKFCIREKTRGHGKIYGPYKGKFVKYNKPLMVKLKTGKTIKIVGKPYVKLSKNNMVGGLFNNKRIITIKTDTDLKKLINIINSKDTLSEDSKNFLKENSITFDESRKSSRINNTLTNNCNYHFHFGLSNLDINTYNITSMESLFENFDFINHSCDDVDISKWNVNRVKNMKCMFKKSKGFNQNLNKWNLLTDNEENYKTMHLDYMFEGCKNFCENSLDSLNWKVYKYSILTGMFDECEQLFDTKVIKQNYITSTEKYLKNKIKIKYIGKNGNELMTIKLVNGIYGYNCMFNGKHCTAID